MISLDFKSESDSYLTVNISSRLYPKSFDYWDGNWVDAEIIISNLNTRGIFKASLRTEEFLSFHKQLKELRSKLKSEAKFETMEEWISFVVQRIDDNSYMLSGKTKEITKTTESYEFVFKILEKKLSLSMKQLEYIIEEFPVIGSP